MGPAHPGIAGLPPGRAPDRHLRRIVPQGIEGCGRRHGDNRLGRKLLRPATRSQYRRLPQDAMLGRYKLSFPKFGGDRIGAVLLSPFLKPGTLSNTPFNHYALLKTVEDIFGLD